LQKLAAAGIIDASAIDDIIAKSDDPNFDSDPDAGVDLAAEDSFGPSALDVLTGGHGGEGEGEGEGSGAEGEDGEGSSEGDGEGEGAAAVCRGALWGEMDWEGPRQRQPTR